MQDRRGVLAAQGDADDRGGGLAVDAEFGEQEFAHGLALGGGTGRDDRGDSIADLDEVVAFRLVGGSVQEKGQLVAAVAELPDLFGDFLDAAGDGVAVDLVVLVLDEIAIDDGFFDGELLLKGRQFGLVAGPGLLVLGPRCCYRLARFVEPVGEEVLDRVEHCGVERVGVDPGSGAVIDAVSAAGPAGVIAVGAAAAVCVGADVPPSARRTLDLAGEVVVGRASGLRGGFATLREDFMGQAERCEVDHRSVGFGSDDVAEADLAEVDAVGEHVCDGLVAPRP
nr:hypothetical protein [Virgisporangium aurantiacum]